MEDDRACEELVRIGEIRIKRRFRELFEIL